MQFIDNFLNRITMYRLVLYALIFIWAAAAVLCAFGVLPYNVFYLIYSTAFLLSVGLLTNELFAKVFKVPANSESVYISALILALIITPAKSFNDYIFLFWAAVLTMAGKYILAISKKHIFNPVAVAVVITALALNQSASWWVGTAWMLPFVLLAGLLIVKKIQRIDLVYYFLLTALVTTWVLGAFGGSSLVTLTRQTILGSPLLFFAFVMLTEPLTTPPTNRLQICYGVLVGFLIAPQIHVGNLYFSPELALVTGNIFSYLASPKRKLMLSLKQKVRLGPDIYDFVFRPDRKLAFTPGQYLEWTLGHKKSDSRGNRRYFTLASSPTESEIIMGVKFYNPPSSFKKALFDMASGQTLLAGQLAGDFTMPKDKTQKLVFIAGGIGITPFRSMLKYLIDKNERRDIVLFYANRTADEIVYRDVFDRAGRQLGIKTVYTLTKQDQLPAGWNGEAGYITERMIQAYVPDFHQRTFYISGPRSMTAAFEQTLANMGLHKRQIKIDFFPGFA
jgi:ferredoxin-NADP reductase/Na+-translocating ferredoxin:NAD+ oxidoreductase RnfD subunit